MNKKTTNYCVLWDSHARHMCTVLCSLMEHQSLVDVAICCGTNTVHAHKCVLAANSPYFKEQLENNINTEQIIINGLDFKVVKCIIEFMYCGETNVSNEIVRYVGAAAKYFQMHGLQAIIYDRKDLVKMEPLEILPPLFVSKTPKYPNALPQIKRKKNKNDEGNEFYKSRMKRSMHQMQVSSTLRRPETERAEAEAEKANRLAFESLQQELNFPLPSTSYAGVDAPNNQVSFDYTQVEPYNNDNLTMNATSTNYQVVSQDGKLTDAFCDPNNIEFMFGTNEGNFVGMTDELMSGISENEPFQYQYVDGNVQVENLTNVQVHGHNDGNNLDFASAMDPTMPVQFIQPNPEIYDYDHVERMM